MENFNEALERVIASPLLYFRCSTEDVKSIIAYLHPHELTIIRKDNMKNIPKSGNMLIIDDTINDSIINKVDWTDDFMENYNKIIFCMKTLKNLGFIYHLTGKILKGKNYFTALCRPHKDKSYPESLIWPEYGMDMSKEVSLHCDVEKIHTGVDYHRDELFDMDSMNLINESVAHITGMLDEYNVIVCSRHEDTLKKIAVCFDESITKQGNMILRYSLPDAPKYLANVNTPIILMKTTDLMLDLPDNLIDNSRGFQVVCFPMAVYELNMIYQKTRHFKVKSLKLLQ